MPMITVDPNNPKLYLIGGALFCIQGIFSIIALIMSWTGLIWPYRGAAIAGILLNFLFGWVMYCLYRQLSSAQTGVAYGKEDLEELFKDVH